MEFFEKAKQYQKILHQVMSAFDEEFSGRLIELSEDKIPVKEFDKVYRYILLDKGIDQSFHSTQLDWEQIERPYQSWSISKEGCDHFLQTREKDLYVIVLEASVRGFSLIELAEYFVTEIEDFYKNQWAPYLNKNQDKVSNSEVFEWEEVQTLLKLTKSQINSYQNEKEIIAIEVLDWKIIDSFTS